MTPRLSIIAASIRKALGGNIGKSGYADEYWSSVVLSLRGNTPVQDFKTETVLNMHMDGADPDWGSVVLGMHMGGGEVDPYWSNVSLLMLMNGTNASTAIGEVTGKTVTVAGNAQISTTQSKFGGASCYFDGAGDYLIVPSSTDLNLGTGDYTAEFWIYTTSLATRQIIFALGSGGLCISISTTGQIEIVRALTAIDFTATASITINTWIHVAVSRSGTSLKVFSNGTLVGNFTSSTSYSVGTSYIGIDANGTSTPLTGYIDNLRITKGVARYTDTFTPPNREFPAGANTIYDVKGHPVTVAGNTAIVATKSRFGGYSCYFDGTGDYLIIPNSPDLSFGTGDFTIETWVYLSSSPSIYTGILDRRSTPTTSSYAFGIYNSSGLKVDFVYPGARLTGAINLNVGIWNHIAVTRTSGLIRLFVNGVVESGTATYASAMDSSSDMVVGAVIDPYYTDGYIDDLRITKGIARYTAAFTPPSRAFPHDFAFYDEKGLVPTVTGSPTVSTGTLKYGYGSASLNGTTDYLTFDARSDFGLTAGDFTLEAWVKTSAVGTLVDFRNYAADYGHFYIATGGYLAFDHTYGAIVGTTTVTDNTWHHVAFVRYNNILTMYVDGADSGAAIANANIGSNRQARIGAKVDGTNFFSGNIDQLRITKGVARYVGEFTPQKYAFDDDNNNVIWRDEVALINLTPVGTVAVSGSSYKYGNGSIYFDGTFSKLTGTLSSAIGTEDVTVELWYNPGAIDLQVLVDFRAANDASGFSIDLGNSVSGKLNIFTATSAKVIGSTTLVTGTWYHVAAVRTSGKLRLYVNGVEEGTAYSDTANYTSTSLTIGNYIGSTVNTANAQGYIDDLRITKGVARYVSNFTPPVRQNANYGLPVITDPYWDAVVLGMHMDGADNGTTFTDVKGKTVTANGNAVTKTATKKFGTASAYFDGTGDYLTVPDDVAWDFVNSGDFTLEFWFNISATSNVGLVGQSNGSGSNPKWAVYLNDSTTVGAGVVGIHANDGTIFNVTATWAPSANVWNHLAICRSGNDWSFFGNGALLGTSSQSRRPSASTGTLRIGSDGELYRTTTGYIDDLRITKGVARYTANFQPAQYAFPEVRTPVKTHLDPHYDSVVLNMHMNGPSGSAAFVDEKGNVFTAVANASLSTTQSKFGGVSANFDGTGDYIIGPASSDFDFGTGDFTIEMWVKSAQNATAYATLIGKEWLADYTGGWSLQLNGATNFLSFWAAAYSTGAPLLTAVGSSITNDSWHHVAIVRYGNLFSFYIDGTLNVSTTQSFNFGSAPSKRISIGTDLYFSTAARCYNGYIDDLRVTKGVARYTQNFTLPALPNPDFKTTPAATDPYWKNVVLHMPMNGADAGTTFTENTGKTVTVVGNTSTQVEQYRFGGSSAYFDGTGDYLSVPASPNLNLLDVDFTIEAWVNLANSSTYQFLIGGATNGDLMVAINYPASSISVGRHNVAWDSSFGTHTIQASAWTHIALSRVTGVLRCFVNGVMLGSPLANTQSYSSSGVIIGAAGGAAYPITGYIDDLRITKGIARYTANFTPPSLPNPTGYDPYAPNVVLHLPMNEDFTDSTGKTVTVSGATISSTVKKYGAGSGYFVAAGSNYLTVPGGTDFNFGTGAFTVELWYMPITRTAFSTVLCGDEPDYPLALYHGTSVNSGNAAWAIGPSNAAWFTAASSISVGPMVDGVWYHLALVRSGDTFTAYKNGVAVTTGTTDSAGQAVGDIGTLSLAKNAAYYTTCYIDDLRITKGVARYTANFTPPREPFYLG